MAVRSLDEYLTRVPGRQKGLRDLRTKLNLQLESDLAKLLQYSSYCDLELVVDSESLFSHSCILKTRAKRFYTFITTECVVTQTSVVTTIVIENASTIYIKTFLESIYSSAFLPEAEAYVIKYLQNTKVPSKTIKKDKCVEKFNAKILSPDSEAYFTPKCSPSELYKPFTLLTTSQEEINLSLSKNNASVRSYYRIVSLDEFQSDNHRELETSFEKELAEQDELFNSLKFITEKKNKVPAKPVSLPLVRVGRALKETREPVKRLPHWRPKLCEVDTPYKNINRVTQRRLSSGTRPFLWVGSSSPEMDLSSTTPDFGLDLSLNAPMDTTERPLVEAPIAPPNSTVKGGLIFTEEPACPPSVSLMDDYSVQKTSEANGNQEYNLEEEDLQRLDAMERNMKDCELFLEMEKKDASLCKVMNDKLCVGEQNLTVEKTKTDSSPVHDTVEVTQTTVSGNDVASLSTLCPLTSSPKQTNGQVPNACDDWKARNSVSSNFFIDASSLLDEDEIASPPVSLPPLHISETCDLVRQDVGNEGDPTSSSSTLDPAMERRQGELIFKTSIPHFSRHEVDQPVRLFDSFQDEAEPEQVVPVGDCNDDLMFGDDSSPHPYSQSLPCDSISGRYNRQDSQPLENDVPAETDAPVSLRQHSNGIEPCKTSRAVDVAVRKISVECMPIVSGGASPKDFSTSSYTGSPHLPRRQEHVPIISGGMDLPVEPKSERKHKPAGEVWVVDVGPDKLPGKRFLRGTSSESESETSGKGRFSPRFKVVSDFRQSEVNCSHSHSLTKASVNQTNEEKPRTFPVEKSASFGYFIDLGRDNDTESSTVKPKKHKNDSSNLKKNIFSMFIDMKDEPEIRREHDSGAASLTPKATNDSILDTMLAMDSDGTESGSGSVCSKASGKKPLYMFIEAESSAVKRKVLPGVQKLSLQSSKSSRDKVEVAEDLSLTSLESTDSKLNHPLSSRSSVERDVWNWDNASHQPQGKWTNFDHASTTSKEKANESKISEVIFKKDSTFIIGSSDRKLTGCNNVDLFTVMESTPPKSPNHEEKDSGVIVTEESDDSFVRLSDMDNRGKNPYMDLKRRKEQAHATVVVEAGKRHQNTHTTQGGSRMSQSIPEATWHQKKPSRIPEREKVMSRSTGGGAAPPDAGSSGHRISKSLSRLFPNLSASTLNLARTHTPEASEPSSMMSSIDPYGLEISTSETDVSCHGDGATRLGQDLLRMFLDEISPDVVVDVGGRRMKAHKCILSSRCQYFAAMLSGGWVESAGNVISLQGFSYAVVHFALCHIYSGESQIPETLNIVELATLADMLCLEGLKEVISYTLRIKYCHAFHSPCHGCIVGVLDCLPVAADYGLDDLYRKCLRWTAKFFVKVWPTKAFANLRREHMEKCLQYQVVHMTVENILDTFLGIDKVRGSLPSIRWAETVTKVVNKLQDASLKFLADHFSNVLTSDHFLALGKDAEWSIDCLEKSLIQATGKLSPEQACWSHARLHSLMNIATSVDPLEEMQWNEGFVMLLSTLSEHVQNSLVKQAPRAARSKAWQQMEPELRNGIQEAACLVLPPENNQAIRRSASKVTSGSTMSSTLRSSTRALDLRQVKLAMAQQVNRTGPVRREQASEQRSMAPLPLRRNEVRKSQSASAVRETLRPKGPPPHLAEVKSRYLQPRSPHKTLPDNGPATRRSVNGVSSSDSSRNCSPAMARAASGRAAKTSKKPVTSQNNASRVTRPFSQLTADDNMSTDSLATESSCGEKEARKGGRGKENTVEMRRPAAVVITTPSLPRKTQSLSSFPSANKHPNKPKTLIPRIADTKSTSRGIAAPLSATANTRSVNYRSSMSPQLSGRQPQRSASKTYANVVNGNVHSKTVDSENNATNVAFKPPAIVSRSGTFLKDEPTILKKPQADVV